MKGGVSSGLHSKIVIGKYSYYQKNLLGKGYSSQVFLGTNQKTGEQVAIKVVKIDPMNKQLHQNLIKSQLEVIKSLQVLCNKGASNIINVFEAFQFDKKVIIVSELCQTDLQKQIKKNTLFSQEKAIRVIQQVLIGYRNLFLKNIIHRDLKPANILFKNKIVKIADFGFSTKTQNLSQCSNVGSPAYMSPQALQKSAYSFKSDIWSIGVIFYEMICGRTPWTARGQINLINNIKKSSIETLLPSHISESSKTFLRKTLCLNLDQRINPEQFFAFRFGNQNKQQGIPSPQKKKYSFSLSGSSKNKHCQINKKQFTQRSSSIKIGSPQKKLSTSIFEGIDVQASNSPENLTKKKFDTQKNSQARMKSLLQFYKKNNSIQLMGNQKAILQNKSVDPSFQMKSINNTVNYQGSSNCKQQTQNCQVKQEMSDWNMSKINYKQQQISNQLLSKVYFCRFSAKIIVNILLKIQNLEKHKIEKQKERLSNLSQQMYGLIITIFNDVSKLNYYHKAQIQSYSNSSQYQKIKKSVQVCMQKYQALNLQSKWQGFRSIIKITKETILNLYIVIRNAQNSDQVYHQIVLVDLLITFYQIVQLLRKKDNMKILSKQKMLQIAEGKITKSVSRQHVIGIQIKLAKLKIICDN